MAIQIQDIRERSPDVEVEGDIEFVPSPIQDKTNAMIVGPAQKGPVFVPTTVRTREQFRTIFGDPTTYSSYSALKTLEQTDRVTFTRVIDSDGWNPVPIVILGSGGTDFPHFDAASGVPLAVLIFSDRYKRVYDAVPEKTELLKSRADQSRIARDFTLRTFDSQNNVVDEWRLSLNPFSPRYIERVLPPDVRIYQNFRETQRESIANASEDTLISIESIEDQDTLSFDTFDTARTPWILSQDIQNGNRSRLFRVWVKSDGEAENRRFKISISDIGASRSESGWKTFTLQLRDFEDTDFNPTVVEEYDNLSLNPSDERFIGKVIGTEYSRYNEESNRVEMFEDYEGESLNIRVEISPDRKTKDTVPFGFEPYKRTFSGSQQVPVYVTERSSSSELLTYLNNNDFESERGVGLQSGLFFGINFRVEQNENFFQAVPEGAEEVDDGFKLDNYIDVEESDLEDRKFSLGFQGGSDGQSIYREIFVGEDIQPSNTFGLDLDGKFSGGQLAYQRVFNILDEVAGGYEFNLLTTPELDIQNHERVVREADRLVRERGDAFYVFDSYEVNQSPETALRPNVNSTYSATYFGWVSPIDSDFDLVPPSAIIPQTYAKSDQIADPWITPAGVDRGEVPNVDDVGIRLTRQQLDSLYEKQINPVHFSDSNGVLLLGNKTLSPNLDSLLSSIDVRRTAVYIVNRARGIGSNYVFEQNDQTTAQNFRADLIEVLSNLQRRSGIREYEVTVNANLDRNVLDASVSFVPQPSSEYITIDFVIREQTVNVVS